MYRYIFFNFLKKERTVTDICIRCQQITHFHEMDALSFHAEMDRTFAACEAASEYNDVVCHFILFFIIIVDYNNIFSAKSRNRRDKRCRTCRNDQCVRILLLHILRRHFRVQTDLNACLFRKKLIGAGQFVHFMLEGQCLLTFQNSADLILFLTENDLVSAARCRVCRIESARTSACYKHFFPLALPDRDYLGSVHLTPDQRIHCTAPGRCRCPLSHAGEAAEAANDFLVPVLNYFSRKFRICQKRTGHVYDICLTAGNDLFHLSGVIQTADRCDGLAHMLFDFRSKVDITSMIREHGWMCISERLLICTGGDMDDVHVGLNLLCDLHAVFQPVSFRDHLGTAHPELKREERTHCLSDSFENFHSKAAAVFQCAAVLVRAVVEHG